MSDPFIVDHESPSIAIALQSRGATITVKDQLTRLVKAAYALDGGDSIPVFPDDGLFDSPPKRRSPPPSPTSSPATTSSSSAPPTPRETPEPEMH